MGGASADLKKKTTTDEKDAKQFTVELERYVGSQNKMVGLEGKI